VIKSRRQLGELYYLLERSVERRIAPIAKLLLSVLDHERSQFRYAKTGDEENFDFTSSKDFLISELRKSK